MKLFLAATLLLLAGCSQAGGTSPSPLASAGTSPTTTPASATTSPTTAPASGSPSRTTAPASASPSAAADTPAPSNELAIRVLDFKIDPAAVTVKGTTVTLAVTNDGPTVHNVKVRDEAGTILLETKDLREGESETVSADIPAGSYVMFCSLPGHESLGTKGTLEVDVS